jgi:hypothetical protein
MTEVARPAARAQAHRKFGFEQQAYAQYRNAHVLEDPVVLLDSTVVNRDPRVVDGLVRHAERISLRRPSQVINRLGRVSLSTGVDHIDSDHFARLRLGDQFLLVETPPGGRIRRLNDRPPLFDLRLLKGAQTSGVRCSRGGISISLIGDALAHVRV